MTILIGPWCLVCDGDRVVNRREWGITAFTSEGPKYGWVTTRAVCLDCEERNKQMISDSISKAIEEVESNGC